MHNEYFFGLFFVLLIFFCGCGHIYNVTELWWVSTLFIEWLYQYLSTGHFARDTNETLIVQVALE